MIHVDFETKSRIDIMKCGAYKYAADHSTDVLMMAWANNDEPVRITTDPERMVEVLEEALYFHATICAHNAQFERLIMQHVLNIDCVPEHFYCTATQARANNLPGSLGHCAWAIGAKQQKSDDGYALIRLFSIPNASGSFNNRATHPEEWAKFMRYCKQDVETERTIHKMMRPLTKAELQEWWVSERINDRGLLVDVDFAKKAIEHADDERADIVNKLTEITNGVVVKATGTKLTQYVYDRVPPAYQDRYLDRYRDNKKTKSLDADTRYRLLQTDGLDPHVREVIELADAASAPSTAKYRSMIRHASEIDNRVRGAYVFGAASSTGRFSARGLQVHNFPRQNYSAEDDRRLREDFNPKADGIMLTLKKMLRPSIKATPGRTFICSDWEQIEGRLTPWLSVNENSEPALNTIVRCKLNIYADKDRDLYCETASNILGYEVTKDMPERQSHGKVPELSLGFGGGYNALLKMAKAYNVTMDEYEARDVVYNWRANNLWATCFWDDTMRAAESAIRHPGDVFNAGKLKFMFQPGFLGDTLWNLLPSGRLLCYPSVRIESSKYDDYGTEITALKANWKPKANAKEWPRNKLWHGVLVENAVQATAADLLRQTLVRCEEAGLIVVGHTHDEILLEHRSDDVDARERQLCRIMCEGFDWTEGLPLAVDSWTGGRYRK